MYMRSGEVKLHMLAVTSSLSQRGRHSTQRGQQPIPLPTTISRSTKQKPQHQYHFPLSLSLIKTTSLVKALGQTLAHLMSKALQMSLWGSFDRSTLQQQHQAPDRWHLRTYCTPQSARDSKNHHTNTRSKEELRAGRGNISHTSNQDQCTEW